MYVMQEINGVLHCVRDLSMFKNGGIVLDDTPLVVQVDLDSDDQSVVSIREQLERLYARERAAALAAQSEEEGPDDEDDFDLDDLRYRGTSSAELRETSERLIALAEALEAAPPAASAAPASGTAAAAASGAAAAAPPAAGAPAS